MCNYTTPTTWACGHTTGLTQFDSLCDEQAFLRKHSKPFKLCSPPAGSTDNTAFCEACNGLVKWCKGPTPASMIVGGQAFQAVGPDGVAKVLGKGIRERANRSDLRRDESRARTLEKELRDKKLAKDIAELEEMQAYSEMKYPNNPEVQRLGRELPGVIEHLKAKAAKKEAKEKEAENARQLKEARRWARREESKEERESWLSRRSAERRGSFSLDDGREEYEEDVGWGQGGQQQGRWQWQQEGWQWQEGGWQWQQAGWVQEPEAYQEPFPLFLPDPAEEADDEGAGAATHVRRGRKDRGRSVEQRTVEVSPTFDSFFQEQAQEADVRWQRADEAWQEAEAAWQAAGIDRQMWSSELDREQSRDIEDPETFLSVQEAPMWN